MRIWLVGGGTAGHALPLTALASELESQAELTIITDHSQAAMVALADSAWPIKRIVSGKFRRYHGRGWRSRLLDFGTLTSNILDIFKLGGGFIQALWLVLRRRPDVIFINGGSVGVPVAWAGRLFGRPYLIHESDTKAGLANRLIAKRAKRILLGFDSGQQTTDPKVQVTGIPPRAGFAAAKQAGPTAARAKLNLSADKPLLLITGGSQGAANINEAVSAISDQLVKRAVVVHLCGAANEESLKPRFEPFGQNYRLLGFVGEDMSDYLAAADLVVARAGASTLADLAYFAKPAILIPNPLLVGGHQLTNAEAFGGAAVVLDEAEVVRHPQSLLEAVNGLLGDQSELTRLSQAIGALARPDATKVIAEAIVAVGRGE